MELFWLNVGLVFCLAVLCYFIGSLPFGVIIGKIKGVNLIEEGSGNIGTANAFRVLGPIAGTITFLGDASKGFLSIYLGQHFGFHPAFVILLGAMAILGHSKSIFLEFKGGKGVATLAGIYFAIDWRAAVGGMIVWAIIVAITRYSSVGSMAGAFAAPFVALYFGINWWHFGFFMLMFVVIVYLHKKNIKNLRDGSEKKLW